MEKDILLRKITLKNNIKSSPFYILYIFLSALIFATTTFLDSPSPLIVGLMCSLSGFNTIIAMAGALLGLLITGRFFSAMILIGGLILVLSVRLFLSPNYGITTRIVMTTIAVFINGFFKVFTISEPSQLAEVIVFSVIGGTFYLSLSEWQKQLTNKAHPFSFEKPSILLSSGLIIALVTATLADFQIGIITLGAAFSGVLILFAAEIYGVAGGAIVSVFSALGLGLGGVPYRESLILFALSGLIAGLIVNEGKLSRIIAFTLTGSAGIILASLESMTLFMTADCLAASAIYLVVPTSVVSSLVRKDVKINTSDYKNIIAERLKFASATIHDLKRSIEKTANTLDKSCSKNINWVIDSTCDKVCRKCSRNASCWGDGYSVMTDSFNKITAELRKGKLIETATIPPAFAERCNNQQVILAELNRNYRQFLDMQQATRRIADMRWILTEQLSSTQKLLFQLSSSVNGAKAYDEKSAALIEQILAECGISSPVAGVIINEKGRMSIEAFGSGTLNCTRAYFCELAMAMLNREFDLPEISYGNKTTRITLFEKATFSVEMEIAQLNKGKNRISGDYYDSYIDENGTAYIALSDGMGSGSRARVDSAFTCGMMMKLLRSGIGLSAATAIVNTSVAVKSCDESFSTLDVCKIDLYTGAVNIYKAGSAPTYIKNRNRIIKIPSVCPPIGGTELPDLDRQGFLSSEGDIILMASDGVSVDEAWLTRELASTKITSMKELTQRIATTAKLTADKSKDDDITVIAIKLVR